MTADTEPQWRHLLLKQTLERWNKTNQMRTELFQEHNAVLKAISSLGLIWYVWEVLRTIAPAGRAARRTLNKKRTGACHSGLSYRQYIRSTDVYHLSFVVQSDITVHCGMCRGDNRKKEFWLTALRIKAYTHTHVRMHLMQPGRNIWSVGFQNRWSLRSLGWRTGRTGYVSLCCQRSCSHSAL